MLEHLARARCSPVRCALQLVVGAVEVVQVVGRDRAEDRACSSGRHAASASASSSACVAVEQLGQPVHAVDRDGADPGQVVEPGVAQPHPVGLDPEPAASRRWKPMATLHRPIARWPSSSRARVTMPTGLVKSTIQASGSARRRTSSAMSSTTGTVRSALAKPPGPGGLLADQAELVRQRLVDQPGRLAADPQLDQHRGRTVDRRGQVGRRRSAGRRTLPGRMRWASPPTTRSRSAETSCSTSSSTVEHVGAAGEALDELGRVRAAAADRRRPSLGGGRDPSSAVIPCSRSWRCLR